MMNAMLQVMRLLTWVFRWFIFLFEFGVIWPLATVVLFAALVLWNNGTTPGTLIAQEITRVAGSNAPGLFTVSDCGVAVADVVPVGSPRTVLSACEDVTTDAAGYAARWDHEFFVLLKMLWLTLALVFLPGRAVSHGLPRLPTGRRYHMPTPLGDINEK
ncbi:conjugal transfer protein TraP [Pectobacterium aroidearum]|uniref:conjugal transfer protein TraP n=1 Tax=Pectobacterium aroidearum TaxID=1201031 RepID=UPI003015D6B9